MFLLSDSAYKSSSKLPLVFSIAMTLLLVLVLAFTVNWEFVTQLDYLTIWEYRAPLLQGLFNTLWLTVASLVFGLAAGIVLAILLQIGPLPLRWLISAYVEIWRNVPLIVQLFWIHFIMPEMTGISTTAMTSGAIAISLQASAYLTDIARAGIQAVPRGQVEAAESLGMPRWNKWVDIILPQALRLMIGPLVNVSLSFFKATSILGVLSVGELMSTAIRVTDYSFKPIETLTTVAFIYFLCGILFTTATRKLEDKMVRR